MNYFFYRISTYILIKYFEFQGSQTRHTPEPVFFIVSAGRSGTTLLRKLLTSKYKLHIPPESDNLIILLAKYYVWQSLLGSKIIGLKNLELSVRKIFSSQVWKLDDCPVIDLISSNGKLLHPKVAVYNLYHYHAAQCNPGAALLGDKTPYLVLHLNLLKAIFPDLKLIHIIRDGRRVVQSRIKNFHERTDVAALRWVWAVEESNKFKEGSPQQIIEIKYEDLVKDAEKTLLGVEEFLELKGLKRKGKFELDLGDDVLPHHSRLKDNIEMKDSIDAPLAFNNQQLLHRFNFLLYKKGYPFAESTKPL